ncbi:MAG: serine/threonine-protein kinase, partial [Aeoliella sp.]
MNPELASPAVARGNKPLGSAGNQDPPLAEILEDYLAELAQGEKPDRDGLLARYPELNEQLTECLDGLELVHHVAPQLGQSVEDGSGEAATDAVHEKVALGDFQIIREIGRGGMGVVYEAKQLSLGRHVALKVLPFAAMLDKRQLARFKNEAQAAAVLQHQHIVPVYSIGCDRGVHYYAMQYVEGQPLDKVIAALEAGTPPNPSDARLTAATLIASRLNNGSLLGVSRESSETDRNGAVSPSADSEPSLSSPAVRSAMETAASGGLSTEREQNRGNYFRSVAKLMIQVSEALDYAHQHGIAHRDIKPANLLMDDAGDVWVTDFGLALVEANPALTITGDIVGTLRYMSPEQALAKRVVVDHRTDIYSLGATLYELLTLRPVFSGPDRQELLRQIAFEEPRPPRRVDGGVPRDLETICLKTLEKNPTDRYTTAQEMADDLCRFVDDKPVQA